jgi:hypothetical protein
MEEPTARHFLSNKTYDVLKFIAVVALPALGTLYFILAEIWGLPSGQQVLGTIVALEGFLAVILGISNKSYDASGAKYAGAINMSETSKGLMYTLELKGDPEDIQHQNDVTFKVNTTK